MKIRSSPGSQLESVASLNFNRKLYSWRIRDKHRGKFRVPGRITWSYESSARSSWLTSDFTFLYHLSHCSALKSYSSFKSRDCICRTLPSSRTSSHILRLKVCADFHDNDCYYSTTFFFIFSMWQIDWHFNELIDISTNSLMHMILCSCCYIK